METEKNMELWRIAKKRVGFKRHLGSYIIVNTMLWMLWLFTDNQDNGDRLPWPVWPMIGWGIGLAFSYKDAYHSHNTSAVQKEYDKLNNKEG